MHIRDHNTHSGESHKHIKLIERYGYDKSVFVLRTDKEIAAFLAQIDAENLQHDNQVFRQNI